MKFFFHTWYYCKIDKCYKQISFNSNFFTIKSNYKYLKLSRNNSYYYTFDICKNTVTINSLISDPIGKLVKRKYKIDHKYPQMYSFDIQYISDENKIETLSFTSDTHSLYLHENCLWFREESHSDDTWNAVDINLSTGNVYKIETTNYKNNKYFIGNIYGEETSNNG